MMTHKSNKIRIGVDHYYFGYCQYYFCETRGDIVQRFDKRGSHYAVSNRTTRDCFGRAITTYANVWTDSLVRTYHTHNLDLIVQTDYDVMDRPIFMSWADGITTDTWYGIGYDAFGHKRLLQHRYDENGNEWQQYTSPQGWTTTSIAPDGAITYFEYDALGQLLQSTDPDGLVTIHSYDGFGRRTERNHPDAGTTIWTYDAADNLIASATQVQLDNNEETVYEYDYNQLTAVRYPRYPQYDITYEYDSETGRLYYVSDITGDEYFEYDAMGNVSMSDKYIAVPTENMTYNLVTRYRYDSFGRMRRITYPDGEKVDYTYRDGQLYSVENTEGDVYIRSIVYDEYDAPVQTTYGNGMVGRSSYDDIHHRLAWRELYDTYHIPLQETQYEYDGVGNIVRTRQYASAYGGLGGEYAVVYGYDEQNRLLDARQYNSETGNYSYFMSYSPSGLVGTKVSPELNADMVFGYRYDGGYISHQPKIISSVSDEEDMTLMGWNADGQMTSMVQPNQDRFRKHMWDEAGQLAVAIGNEYCGYYGYNANGERVYKLTGSVYADQYNAGDVNIETYFDDVTLYVNPYMVITPRGYTKHYYNGSQRIAARLGDYWSDSGIMVDEQDRMNLAREVLEDRMNSTEVEEESLGGGQCRSIYGEEFSPEPYILRTNYMNCIYDEDMLWEVFNGNIRQSDYMDGIAQGIFYYHSDHLGSANWITDDQGQAVQYIHYMPYGELWVNQQANSYDERFKFTGKERDAETGYDYFGARYYSPMIGHWLSPDPLANKYPNISPYAYCSWNPLRYVDPNGKEICIVGEDGVSATYLKDMHYTGNDAFIKESIDKLNVINNITAGTGFMETLIESPLDFSISMADSKIDGTLSTTSISDTEKQISAGRNASIEDLGHELFHTYQYANGQGGMSIYNEVEAYLFQAKLGYVLNNGSGGSMLETVINTSTNAAYTDAVNTLLFGQQYDKQSFNVVVSSFLQHSRANVGGVYNKYSLQQPTQKRSLIQPFYPIYP